MKISIAERFRPFTHVPGAKFVLPGSQSVIEVFPTKVVFDGEERPFLGKGFVEKFTALYDMEHSQIVVSGVSQGKFFKVFINSKNEISDKKFIFENGSLERLSFGCTKQQNFEKIYERGEIKEFLPFWFFLGVKFKREIPFLSHSLLENLQREIVKGDILEVKKLFKMIFKVGFSSCFFPNDEDHHCYGSDLPLLPKDISREGLLGIGYQLIKSCFIEEREEGIHLLRLPLNPSGRLIFATFSFGRVSIEWTKHRLRRVEMEAFEDKTITLHFPKELRQARIDKEKVVDLPVLVLNLKKGKSFFLDHFIS